MKKNQQLAAVRDGDRDMGCDETAHYPDCGGGYSGGGYTKPSTYEKTGVINLHTHKHEYK